MRIFLSYIMSHMYDIHAIVAGAMVVAAMMYIKVPVKKKIKALVDVTVQRKPEQEQNRATLEKRGNASLIVCVFPLAVAAFWILSVLSPFIIFSWQSSAMAGVFALCIYAFIEQVSEPVEERK